MPVVLREWRVEGRTAQSRQRLFDDFALPARDAKPIGITADGNMWFCAKGANKIGCHSIDGEITLFALPAEKAGPDGTLAGPDGNVWFSETDAE
jgi:virginiamycin B lyase